MVPQLRVDCDFETKKGGSTVVVGAAFQRRVLLSRPLFDTLSVLLIHLLRLLHVYRAAAAATAACGGILILILIPSPVFYKPMQYLRISVQQIHISPDPSKYYNEVKTGRHACRRRVRQSADRL